MAGKKLATKQFYLRFGALSDSIGQQLRKQGIEAPVKNVRKWDAAADAVTLLHLRGYLRGSHAQEVRKRIVRELEFSLECGVSMIRDCKPVRSARPRRKAKALPAADVDGGPVCYCGDCGQRLTLVRPGKHQCDNAACHGNQGNPV